MLASPIFQYGRELRGKYFIQLRRGTLSRSSPEYFPLRNSN